MQYSFNSQTSSCFIIIICKTSRSKNHPIPGQLFGIR